MSAIDIPAFVRGLRGGSTVAQNQAAVALARLSNREDSCPALVEAGAIPAAIHLLLRGSSTRAEQATLIMLGNLANASQENAAAAAAAGTMPLVIERIRSGRAALQPQAAFALGNLTICAEARQAALAAGAVSLLLQALRQVGGPVEQHAAFAFKHLLLGPLPMEELSAAVPALVRLLDNPDAKAQEAAAYALSNAALLGGEARAAIAASGAIPRLLRLVAPQGPGPSAQQGKETVAAAVHALAHLATGERERAAILAHEDGVAFFQLLQRHGVGPMREVAELALAEGAAAQNAAAGERVGDADAAAADAAAPAADEQAPPAAGGQRSRQRPRRTCAAPGCGATRGLRPCKGCLTARYCSPACQAADWPEHKAQCHRLREERAAAAAQAADGQAE